MRFALVCLLAACEGPAGPAGPPGSPGTEGTPGANGENGRPGDPASPSPWIAGAGVDIRITDFAMTATNARVRFTLNDVDGVALDRRGLLTEAPVAVSFTLAQLAQHPNGEAAQYTTYVQAESTGTFVAVDVTAGIYEYTFSAGLAGFDPAKTQTVLGVASRTYRGVTAIDRELKSLGTVAREVVTDEKCDSCHATFGQHGGRYTAVPQCVLCHADFPTKIHALHQDGFPRNLRSCESCHGGSQGQRWKIATESPCLSCHDNIVFANPVPVGKQLHAGGAQPPGVNCTVCHPASGGLAGVVDHHYTLDLDPLAPKLAIAIDSITNTGPGQVPVMQFTVTDHGVGRNLVVNPLTSLRATIAGPTSDFAGTLGVNGTNVATLQGSGANGALVAVDAPNGVFSYTFPSAIPAIATGSYQVGLEGYWSPTCGNAICDAGENRQSCAADCGVPMSPRPASVPRFAALSPVKPFAVTGVVAARRTIVDAAKCNGCHEDLSFHGGGRKNPAYCVMCHNANLANAGRISRFEASTMLAEPVDFRVMIHKIHMGDALVQPYVLGANPTPTPANPAGTMVNFGATRYPRSRNDCGACHVANNWMLPLPAYLPSTAIEMTCTEPVGNDTNNYCDSPFWNASATTKTPPQSAVCTSCHDATYVVAHALLNVAPNGVEACATCHGPGATYEAHGAP